MDHTSALYLISALILLILAAVFATSIATTYYKSKSFARSEQLKGVKKWVLCMFNPSVSPITEQTIYFSDDGINWQSNPDNPIINGLNVYFGKTNWVIGGFNYGSSNTQVAYSTDGENFFSGNVSVQGNYALSMTVYFANDIWVASTSSGEQYSTNGGQSWTPSNTPVLGYETINNIHYANGMFIEIGTQLSVGNTINLARSIEGKTWTGITGPFSGNGNIPTDVYFGNGTWVVVGSSSTETVTDVHIYYSSDGITWTGVAGPFGNPSGFILAGGNSVFYGDGVWVTVGKHGTTDENIYYSTDAINWTAVVGPFSTNTSGGTVVKYHDGIWVAGGGSYTTDENIYYSEDNAVTWTAVAGPFGVGGSVTDLSYRNGTWVAVGNGYTGSDAYYSLDGKVWNPCIGIEKESEYNIPISVYVR